MQRHPAQPRDYAAVSVSTPPAARSRQLRRRPVDQFWRAEAGQFSVAVKQYRACFAEKYLKSDTRRLLLAYKVHLRLNRFAQEVIEKGGPSYAYAARAKNLLWALLIQGVLNHPKLPMLLDTYGTALTMEADLNEVIKGIASTKVRLILKDAVADVKYQQLLKEEKYSFLRTKATYTKCMDVAYEKYGWKKQSL